MPGYQTKQESIAIPGAADLIIRSLLDRQQYADPLGEAERLGISSAAWPLFGLPWPSGTRLASRLALRPVKAAERILEVGCGLALASLVGHRRGADVTASDIHPMAAAFLLENLRLNGLLPMKYRHGPWVTGAAGPIDLQGRFDLIIGSDVLYERDTAGSLAAFLGRHAAAACEIWIVDPDRSNRPDFNRRMATLGFGRAEQRLDESAPTPAVGYRGRILTYRRGLN